MSYIPEQSPNTDTEFDDWDQESLEELIGSEGIGLGAFPLESLSVERMFWNGVTILTVTAATVAVGVKLAREVLGR